MQATPGVSQRSTAGAPLGAIEWACIAIATIVAHAFLLHEWLYPSAWDATSYVNIGREIAERGLWSKFEGSGFRTYGYPLVLSVVLRAAAWTGVSFVVLLFELQFLAYCGAALFLRRATKAKSRVHHHRRPDQQQRRCARKQASPPRLRAPSACRE